MGGVKLLMLLLAAAMTTSAKIETATRMTRTVFSIVLAITESISLILTQLAR